MSGAPLLALRQAVARRGPFTLGPVSLEVPAGARVAVIGPNGAGKSTLLLLAAGLLAPSSGQAFLGDAPVAAIPREQLARRVALLSPIAPPGFELTALELVLHGRWAHLTGWRFPGAGDVAIARACLQAVGCEPLASRDVRTLSSGELQRVLLAKALAQEAPLILLDEPTASLDLAQRAAVRRLVDLAAGQGRAVVMVTHDLEAAATADAVILLARGGVASQGSPRQVLAPEPLSAAFGIPIEVEWTPSHGIRITGSVP